MVPSDSITFSENFDLSILEHTGAYSYLRGTMLGGPSRCGPPQSHRWPTRAAVQLRLFSCGWPLRLSHSRPKLLNSLLSLRKVNSEINWTMLGVVLVMIVDEL